MYTGKIWSVLPVNFWLKALASLESRLFFCWFVLKLQDSDLPNYNRYFLVCLHGYIKTGKLKFIIASNLSIGLGVVSDINV